MPSPSPRHWEVLDRFSKGESVGAIGQALFISPSTVRFYMRRLHMELGTQSIVHAYRRALELGVLSIHNNAETP